VQDGILVGFSLWAAPVASLLRFGAVNGCMDAIQVGGSVNDLCLSNDLDSGFTDFLIRCYDSSECSQTISYAS